MTREETIQGLTILIEQALKSHNDTAIIDVKKDSFVFVIQSAIKALEQEPKTEWIPVSERLPNECIKVLVWERYYSYKRERDVYDYNFGWIYDDNWLCEGGGETEVFAWMPLPTPYEPQESEDKE